MTDIQPPAAASITGRVQANAQVSTGLIRLDLNLDHPLDFLPGQFAMLNFTGRRALVFSRPFSILDSRDGLMSFLYRVVGRGTAAMADLVRGDSMTVLGPLGRPFPAPESDRSTVLVAGGVGLPPVHSWLERYGRTGDRAFFGARDGSDVPWALLGENWRVSVDDRRGVPVGREAYHGVVTALVESRREGIETGAVLLACGPVPLLRAASELAETHRWTAWLSLEEHMGCGYGVCKGCVVTVQDPGTPEAGSRNATCCQEGPVFPAESIVWNPLPDAVAPAACTTREEST